jgi:hypothetical protein
VKGREDADHDRDAVDVRQDRRARVARLRSSGNPFRQRP